MKRVPVLCLVIPVLLCGIVSAVDPDGDVNVDGEVDVVDVLWGYRVLMDARLATGDLILEYCGDRLIQYMGHCDRFPVFAAGSCREWHCR